MFSDYLLYDGKCMALKKFLFDMIFHPVQPVPVGGWGAERCIGLFLRYISILYPPRVSRLPVSGGMLHANGPKNA
jgi:hypothetical protein